MKIRLVGAEVAYSDGWTGIETDRQTDTEEEANSLYSQFANAPNTNEAVIQICLLF